MHQIPNKSVDMILCDLPYSSKKRKTTWNEWDCEIDIENLWEHYNRILKDNGVVVLFASDLFSAELIMSNFKNYKYKWIWQKEAGTGFLNAKRMPLRDFEEILVFYKKQPTYNPQMRLGKPYVTTKGSKSKNYCKSDKIVITANNGERYPLTILPFSREKNTIHPTQKPVKLVEYLIKTYTNEGDLILDNAMGSGTTGIAAMNLKRKFIGIEIEQDFFNMAEQRICQQNRNSKEMK
jgi:DNA modification methylase